MSSKLRNVLHTRRARLLAQIGISARPVRVGGLETRASRQPSVSVVIVMHVGITLLIRLNRELLLVLQGVVVGLGVVMRQLGPRRLSEPGI